MISPPAPFYVTGGTLASDAPCYVERRADRDLYEGLTRGEFCYVLTSRQMGKSSLMVRTAYRLRYGGAAVAVLDLTSVGQNLTAEQWYDGLLGQVGRQLNLEDELEDFWLANTRLGPLERWVRALREVVLPRRAGRVVVFVDEIDAVRGLPFSTDEFFAAIRELYNRRAEDVELGRLTFCLLGVATPSDLIRDTRTTPFNVGRRVELRDFSADEAAALAKGLRREPAQAAALLHRVLHWTGGHPYLTQRLCRVVADSPALTKPADVDQVCGELFLSNRARERDDNLLFVRERLLHGEADLAGLLDLYGQVWRRGVPDDETNPLINVLQLSGVARVDGGRLQVRNRIYGHVFDRRWVEANMPDAEKRRQRRAFRRGVLLASGAVTGLFALITGLVLFAWQQAAEARKAHDELLAQEKEKELRRGEILRRVEAKRRVPPRTDKASPHLRIAPEKGPASNLAEFNILEDDFEVDLRDWRPVTRDAPLHSEAYTMTRRTKLVKLHDLDYLWIEARTSGRDLVRRVLSPNPQTAQVFAPEQRAVVGRDVMISSFLGFDIRDIPVDQEFDCQSVSTYWDALQGPDELWFGVIGYPGSYKVSMLMLFPEHKPYSTYELMIVKRGEPDPRVFTGRKIIYEDPGHHWLYWEIPSPEADHVYQLRWQW
jgi:hypothetical protein